MDLDISDKSIPVFAALDSKVRVHITLFVKLS